MSDFEPNEFVQWISNKIIQILPETNDAAVWEELHTDKERSLRVIEKHIPSFIHSYTNECTSRNAQQKYVDSHDDAVTQTYAEEIFNFLCVKMIEDGRIRVM